MAQWMEHLFVDDQELLMRVHPPEMRQQVALEDLKPHFIHWKFVFFANFLIGQSGPKLVRQILAVIVQAVFGRNLGSVKGPGKLWATSWRGSVWAWEWLVVFCPHQNGTTTLEQCCWAAKLGSFHYIPIICGF